MSEVFQEVTLGLTVSEASWEELLGSMNMAQEREYSKARDSRHGAKHPVTTVTNGN